MFKSILRRRLLSVAAGLVVAGAVASGAAIAAGVQLPFSGDGNTINGCYNASSGSLTVLTPTNAKCSTGYKPITWNQTGPKGDKGDKGDPGVAGSQGPAGPSQVYYAQGSLGLAASTAGDIATLSGLPAARYLFSVTVKSGIYATGISDDGSQGFTQAPILCKATLNGATTVGLSQYDNGTYVPAGETAAESFAISVPDASSLTIRCTVVDSNQSTTARASVTALQVSAIN